MKPECDTEIMKIRRIHEHKNQLSSITELIGPDVWIKGVVCICCRMASMYIKRIFKQVEFFLSMSLKYFRAF